MKLKAIKCRLCDIEAFKSPKIEYEQYSTPVDIAASIIYIAETQYSDIRNKHILDLCCGTGILGIAASFLEPSYILGVDIDGCALEVAARNFSRYGLGNKDLIQADFRDLNLGRVDTIIMNPPFGTRTLHADVEAVKAALRHSNVVYSLHKSNTRDYLLRKFKGVALGKINFEIPTIYTFHQKRMCHISVDLIRFTNIDNEGSN